jgi:hypothetical protein
MPSSQTSIPGKRLNLIVVVLPSITGLIRCQGGALAEVVQAMVNANNLGRDAEPVCNDGARD